MSDNVKYKEFTIGLEWTNHGGKWFIQASHRGLTYSAVDEPSLLQETHTAELGKVIGRFLFPPDVGTLLSQELERIGAHDRAGLRLVIVLPEKDKNPEGAPLDLHGIPWEAAVLGAENTYFFAKERVSIVRRWESSDGESSKVDLFTPEYRKLVFLDASQGSNNAGDLVSDIPTLNWDTLGDYEDDLPPTVRSLTALANENVSIFHFTGHGDTELLVLDGKQVRIGQLNDSLKNTRLAVLSACDSAGAPSRPHRSGLAQELAKSVPAVIGMSLRVKDTDALVFSRELYGKLVDGYSLDESVRRGRLKLLERETHALAFALPVFYLGVTGSTRPATAQAVVPSVGPSESLLVEPLAVVRGKIGGAVHGVQASRSGLRVVKLERAGASPALVSFDARVAASQVGPELIIGDIFDSGVQPEIDSTTITLPFPLKEERLLAVARSKGYRTSTLRLVITRGEATMLLTRGFDWRAPRTLDAGFAAAAAVDNPLGTLLLDSADGQVIPAPGGKAGPFSLPIVSGFDCAYSGGVGVAVAWGLQGTKTVVEIQRWDERPGTVRSRDPQWIEVDLGPSFDTDGIIRAGVVRELSPGAVPRTIAVQRGESIELFPLPETTPPAVLAG